MLWSRLRGGGNAQGSAKTVAKNSNNASMSVALDEVARRPGTSGPATLRQKIWRPRRQKDIF